MSRTAKPTDDTATYLLREIDGEVWRRAQIRAITARRDMSELLRAFVRAYGAGKIDVPREQKRRRK